MCAGVRSTLCKMKHEISTFTLFQLSSNEVTFRTDRLYVNKLNIILVQVYLYMNLSALVESKSVHNMVIKDMNIAHLAF